MCVDLRKLSAQALSAVPGLGRGPPVAHQSVVALPVGHRLMLGRAVEGTEVDDDGTHASG